MVSGGAHGFTLVEFSLWLLLASALAALATPALKNAVLTSRATAVAADLRTFAAAFKSYTREHGDWPDGPTAPGVLPAGMAGYIERGAWSRVTPIGGHYTWGQNSPQRGVRYRAVIAIAGAGADRLTADRTQLLEIDRQLDDGDLTGGSFRLGFRDWPVFVLEH